MKAFGFTWHTDPQFYVIAGKEYGEFAWYSDDSAGGGAYWIIHSGDHDSDDFYLIELGGRGPGVWDREIGYFDSPLEAMHAARKDYNEVPW